MNYENLINYENLAKYVKTLPVVSNHISPVDESYIQIRKDQEKLYLLISQEKDNFNMIYVGKIVEETKATEAFLKKVKQNVIALANGTTFVPHNLDGPSYLAKSISKYQGSFYVNGESLTQSNFADHPEVMAHKNKQSLKQKLKNL